MYDVQLDVGDILGYTGLITTFFNIQVTLFNSVQMHLQKLMFSPFNFPEDYFVCLRWIQSHY